ncbi:hypothetical protein K2173_014978 [Erythroxylum novogranatense]|uniref:Uncharacterized protein n=1 Tax=Erythroxylum novogranatense TaxID=1862640 RepID=A0AAV8TTS1_9ROSI|nr:hypothetical protein K2173_014978 [Erythroxylum novogranatense]
MSLLTKEQQESEIELSNPPSGSSIVLMEEEGGLPLPPLEDFDTIFATQTPMDISKVKVQRKWLYLYPFLDFGKASQTSINKKMWFLLKNLMVPKFFDDMDEDGNFQSNTLIVNEYENGRRSRNIREANMECTGRIRQPGKPDSLEISKLSRNSELSSPEMEKLKHKKIELKIKFRTEFSENPKQKGKTLNVGMVQTTGESCRKKKHSEGNAEADNATKRQCSEEHVVIVRPQISNLSSYKQERDRPQNQDSKQSINNEVDLDKGDEKKKEEVVQDMDLDEDEQKSNMNTDMKLKIKFGQLMDKEEEKL